MPDSKVTLFVTCVVDLFQPQTGVAAVKVLRADVAVDGTW